MNPLTSLAQSLAIAYSAGISPYATVALLGWGERLGWVPPAPGVLGAAANPLVLALATFLAVVEYAATLVPGVAALWETVHTVIRPPAAAILAVATVWHADPIIIAIAAILGGGLGLTTHVTKLGLRVAVDTSPEPVTNGIVNTAELGVIASLSYAVWHHPALALVGALALLTLTILLVRAVWRLLRDLLSGRLGAFRRDARPREAGTT